MTYRYYEDNAMYRLNVPQGAPGVQWARQHREGWAVVERSGLLGAPRRLRILPPGPEADEVIGRSVALGNWGKTRSCLYGWS